MSVIACCSLAYGYMRQPPKAGPSVVSWIAISARRPLAACFVNSSDLWLALNWGDVNIDCRRRKRHETRLALRRRGQSE